MHFTQHYEKFIANVTVIKAARREHLFEMRAGDAARITCGSWLDISVTMQK